MKAKNLLPNKYKNIGWVLFIIGLIGGLVLYLTDFEIMNSLKMNVFTIYSDPIFKKSAFFTVIENGIFDELTAICIILGGFFIGFSKEKVEDEFIFKLRNDSLVWALIVNYSILLIAILLVHDITFMHVLVFNMFTPLLFFVIRFSVLKSTYLRHEE